MNCPLLISTLTKFGLYYGPQFALPWLVSLLFLLMQIACLIWLVMLKRERTEKPLARSLYRAKRRAKLRALVMLCFFVNLHLGLQAYHYYAALEFYYFNLSAFFQNDIYQYYLFEFAITCCNLACLIFGAVYYLKWKRKNFTLIQAAE